MGIFPSFLTFPLSSAFPNPFLFLVIGFLATNIVASLPIAPHLFPVHKVTLISAPVILTVTKLPAFPFEKERMTLLHGTHIGKIIWYPLFLTARVVSDL